MPKTIRVVRTIKADHRELSGIRDRKRFCGELYRKRYYKDLETGRTWHTFEIIPEEPEFSDKELFWAAMKHCFKKSEFKEQKDLAQTSGIAESIISNLLNKNADCTLENKTKVAAAFGCSLEEFFKLGEYVLDPEKRKLLK